MTEHRPKRRAATTLVVGCIALFATFVTTAIEPALAGGIPEHMMPYPQEPWGTTLGYDPAEDDAFQTEGLERKTWLPYRASAVDRVEPMEVLPLVKGNGVAAPILSDERRAECAGRSGDSWAAVKGRYLGDVLEAWAACAGWTVYWNTDRRYVLEASAVFSGDFVTASSALLGAFSRAEPPVFGEYFRANQVLLVSTPTELDNQ